MNTRTAYRQQKRLRVLIQMLVGCKWNEVGPLSVLRPEDEKYITKESLLAGLDKAVKKIAKMADHDWRTCQDEDCEECQELVDHGIIEACDSCGTPGHSDLGPEAWRILKTGELLCVHCFDKQGLKWEDCQ